MGKLINYFFGRFYVLTLILNGVEHKGMFSRYVDINNAKQFMLKKYLSPFSKENYSFELEGYTNQKDKDLFVI